MQIYNTAKYTPVTQSILCMIFLSGRAIQHSHYDGHKSKTQFAVYEADMPVKLKQDQGHQMW